MFEVHAVNYRRRRGNVLILFALMVFGLFAMAALVIDIGFARLTQRQMQSAADFAAIDGLRFRDGAPPEYDETSFAAPQDFDKARRLHARLMVESFFDDDLEPENGDMGAFGSGLGHFGAGPVVEFKDGYGDPSLYASEYIFAADNPSSDPERIGSLPRVPVFKPQLEINHNDNAANNYGDMVAGEFKPNPDFPPLNENSAIDEYIDQDNKENYVRRDFVPISDAHSAPAFLVRIRRSFEDFSNRGEYPNADGVASSGPPVPYLFGRGTLLARSGIGRGIAVRATGLSAVRATDANGTASNIGNVTQVGPAFPRGIVSESFGVVGVAPFLLNVEHWPTEPIELRICEVDGFSLLHNDNAQADAENCSPVIGRLFRLTQLATEFSSTDTEIVVRHNVGFPTEVPFKIRLGTEIVTVTAVNENTWIVVRNGGATALTHSANTPVLLHKSLSIGPAISPADPGNNVPQADALNGLSGDFPHWHQYVPLYSESLKMIVGFGCVNWEVSGQHLVITSVESNRIAPSNATASFANVETISKVLVDANRAITNSLLAPVSVR